MNQGGLPLSAGLGGTVFLLVAVQACSGHDGTGDFGSADDDNEQSPTVTPYTPSTSDWHHVGEMPTESYQSVKLATIWDGALYTTDYITSTWERCTLSPFQCEEVAVGGAPDGFFWDGSVSCLQGGRLYLLDGGSNGVTGSYWDYNWEVFNLEALTWAPGGTDPQPWHYPALASDDHRCILVSGWNNYNRTSTVREFDPETGLFTPLLSLPTTPGTPFAGLLGDTLVVAGGTRSATDSDAAATYCGVALDDVWTLDLSSPTASWEAAPSLPMPLARCTVSDNELNGDSFTLHGRFYVVGGMTNTSSRYETSQRIWSWALDEPSWTEEGTLPGTQDSVRTFGYGYTAYLLMVQTGQVNVYAWTP